MNTQSSTFLIYLYFILHFQGDQGEPGDRGPSGDEYISQSPPPQLTVVPGPKGDQGLKGQKGHIGSEGSKGIMGDRVSFKRLNLLLKLTIILF